MRMFFTTPIVPSVFGFTTIDIMDEFKQKMNEECGPGGIKCRCCNPYHPKKNHGKDKEKLNRKARRKLKQKDKNDGVY